MKVVVNLQPCRWFIYIYNYKIRKSKAYNRLSYLVSSLLIIEITCPKPDPGTNTVEVPADLNMKYLDTYTYSCLEGFTTTDDICTVCKSNGTLSAGPPTCTG